jgi:NAD(P)-dependent dehydrogenase (short-subunit alcohol dehydrogenase family)
MNNVIVITGGTRGIGYGLARAFLERGQRVAICGRSPESTDRAVTSLKQTCGDDAVYGAACDISDARSVEAFWDSVVGHFGQVDIWINNAGVSHAYQLAWELQPDAVADVINTNLIGTIAATNIALEKMTAQGHGSIYIMEGAGSDGSRHRGTAIYGTSKYGLRYYTESLWQELPDDSPVKIGTLQPGMVATELLLTPFDSREAFERVRRIFNIIAEPIDTVAPWLADRVLANTRHGARIKYSSRIRMLWKFATSPFNKRDLFEDLVDTVYGNNG